MFFIFSLQLAVSLPVYVSNTDVWQVHLRNGTQFVVLCMMLVPLLAIDCVLIIR